MPFRVPAPVSRRGAAWGGAVRLETAIAVRLETDNAAEGRAESEAGTDVEEEDTDGRVRTVREWSAGSPQVRSSTESWRWNDPMDASARCAPAWRPEAGEYPRPAIARIPPEICADPR